jgi:hypothetical protein
MGYVGGVRVYKYVWFSNNGLSTIIIMRRNHVWSHPVKKRTKLRHALGKFALEMHLDIDRQLPEMTKIC